jgi:hypothetical protein
MPIFPDALLEPRAPLRAVAIGWATAFLPSLPLLLAVTALFPEAQRPELAAGGPVALFLLTIFAPLVESLVMGTVLALLLRFAPPRAAIWISAAGWGVAHSLMAPMWGLVVWWPFLVFSTLYVTWSKRGFLTGVGMAALVHALHNAVPAALIAAGVE